jgi:Fe-S cluster assembly scaffold protein SufB
VLGDEVVNVSTPLLLCGEDDVSGEHATSIGRPNSEKLYYLMSRGFTEKQARILLVEASMSTMLDMIPDTDGRARVLAALREVVEA